MYGIYNTMKKEFQFGIREETRQKAFDRLFKRIGYDSYKWRFEVRRIKEKSMRKCSMCGSYKKEKEFRYMKKQDRYNYYCRDCERLYNKEYQRIYRERKKENEK